jgi:FADH2 O2-dependent halogenase
LYSHFTGVVGWHDILQETHGPSAIAPHAFPCDAAALHQIIDGGWMWVLRFDDGTTSAGFSLNPDVHPIRDEPPEAEWRRLLGAYPSLERQFAQAQAVRPFVRTGRLQRRLSRAAGADWAMLPHAAGFLDAWLSPGIAQTLFAVDRLGHLFADTPGLADRTFQQGLAEYGRRVLDELAWVDEITGACFACFDRFEVMLNVSMIYFIAAHYCEERERNGQAPADAAFLLADDAVYRQIGAALCRRAVRVEAEEAARFAAEVREALQPFNLCSLCDPRQCNMYPYMGTR